MASSVLISPSPGRLDTSTVSPSRENEDPGGPRTGRSDGTDEILSPLSAASRASSLLSPMYTPPLDSGNAQNPFNFTPTTLPKSPVSMSVCAICQYLSLSLISCRASVNGEDINTSTVAFLTPSSKNPPNEPQSPCPIPFQSPPFKNTEGV
jgi:hypothetical protein